MSANTIGGRGSIGDRWITNMRGGAMTLWLVSAALFTIGVVAGAQSDSSGVIHVDPEKVATAIAKGGPLVTRPDLLVSGSHRETSGKVEVHDKETDVLYVVDGEATFVFGGQMQAGNVTSPGQWQGADITGGQTHHIVKGDVFVIPAGVPHWFKEVPKSVSYFVVKVLEP
jgi:mannose-6-phosphate isomerase-like protein (cupin superfamily)